MNTKKVAYLDSPLGWLKIVGQEEAICEVEFLDQAPEGNPNSNLAPVLVNCIQELNSFFEGTLKSFTVHVRQEGTDFQQRVWAELQRIPFGKTISYLDLSRRIGEEKAIRAVGTTNGKNKIAIIVPCHRVIGSDGSLTGYAGGLWRKQWLLEHELKIAHGVSTLF